MIRCGNCGRRVFRGSDTYCVYCLRMYNSGQSDAMERIEDKLSAMLKHAKRVDEVYMGTFVKTAKHIEEICKAIEEDDDVKGD